jgi:hypothetical protein
MAYTVEQAIAEGRRRAATDPKRMRYPNVEAFLKAHAASMKSEINLVVYNRLIDDWLKAGR